MKKATKILSLIFAGIMLSGSLLSCAKPNGDQGEATTAPIAVTAGDETDNGLYLDREKDKLPEDLKFNGEKVKFLYWSDVHRIEFEVAEDADDADRIVAAIKSKNAVVQDRLGIKFEWEGIPGENSARADFVKHVETQNMGGNYYDLIATYSRTSAMLSTRGYLKDINSIDTNYLDFTQNWWSQTLVDTCSIDNSLYFISGDISTNTLHQMYGIFYNKELAATYELGNLSELVYNGSWTIDKLIEMTSDTYRDLDNSMAQSKDDFYGYCTIYYHIDAFYTGSDLMLIDHDPEKKLIISPDYDGEKAINLVSKLGGWLISDSCYVSRKKAEVSYTKPFVNGNALFCQNRVQMADTDGLSNVLWKFGLVPTPKYDLDQKNYITVLGNPFSLYGIGSNTKIDTCCTAVLECLASEAYRRTTPAVFEISMKTRYTKDAEDAQIFDILRNTTRYDLGRIFSDELSYMSELPSICATNNASWKTGAKQQIRTLKNAIANIVTELEKNKK